MKKLIICFVISFSAFFCFAQTPYPTYQTRSSANTIIDDKGANQFRKGLVNGRYADTTAANLEGHIPFYAGAQIVCGDTIWLRNSSATKWINQGPSGSLVSVVTILNDSTILICNINSCDTFVITTITGPITNITILSDTTIQICGSDVAGPELITNGGFVGSATAWTLGALWDYGTNNIIHNFGSTASSFQGGLLTANQTYTVTATIGGSSGTVTISLDGGASQIFSAGAGTVSFVGAWVSAVGSKVNFNPSNDFDGSITDISVKAVLPNCDTLQINPTNIPLDDTLWVVTPLVAGGIDTIHIKQSGPTIRGGDSGYLSTAGYDTFLNKVDTLLHSYGNNQDILQSSINGVVTNWDTLDINCNGPGLSPPQVAWTGTGLIYDVTSGNYRIDCKPYTSAATSITLPAADPTNPYFATFYVDTSGNAGVSVGTPAASPLIPQTDPSWQVLLTSILVPATATIAPIDTTVIYDENVAPEWIPPTAAGTTIDPANTLNPYRGLLSTNVTNINNGDLFYYTAPAPVDLSVYNAVVLHIRLKTVIPAAANIRLQWFNSTVNIGNIIPLPLLKTNITTYQTFSIPLVNFALTTNIVGGLRFSYASNNATVNVGFYVDFIYLQNGVGTTVPADQTNIVAYNGLTHFKNANIDSIRLGGTLNQNTTIATAGFTTTIIGVNTADVLDVTTSSTGVAIKGTATSGVGVQGIASTSGTALIGTASTGIGASISVNPATTNSNSTVIQVQRFTSGTPAAGISGSIDFMDETLAGSVILSNQIISKLTDVTHATRTTELSFTGVNSATTQTLATLAGSGQLTLNQYTTANFNGGVAADSVLVITSAGVVKKRDASVFGGGGGVNIYNADSTFSSNRTASLNGKLFHIAQGANDFLTIDPTTGAEDTRIRAYNTTGNDNLSFLSAATTAVAASTEIKTSFNNGVKETSILGYSDATTSAIIHTADTHTFNGQVGVNVTPTTLFQVQAHGIDWIGVDTVNRAINLVTDSDPSQIASSSFTLYSDTVGLNVQFGSTSVWNGHGSADFSVVGSNSTIVLNAANGILVNSGVIRGNALHNNSFAQGNNAQQDVRSGTYTPTLTNVANVAASTAYLCQWIRVGNVVTVSGKVDIDATSTLTLTQLGISLPIASLFTNQRDCGGTANVGSLASSAGAVLADVTNDRAEIDVVPVSVSNDSFFFTFTYLIL